MALPEMLAKSVLYSSGMFWFVSVVVVVKLAASVWLSCAPKLTPRDALDFRSRKGWKEDEEAFQ